uniref:Uncharacterized protein n=1 Tax=Anguilla anguilla TaxID=7936 RepID=A0A0E9RJB6_ANGAN
MIAVQIGINVNAPTRFVTGRIHFS